MLKLLSSVAKELTLLGRDFAGLLVLFVMPVVLVIVVTLVQENVLKSMVTKTEVLFINMDGQFVGRGIEEALLRSGAVKIVSEIQGKALSVETAKKAVGKGDFPLCIVIPEGTTAAFRKRIRESGKDSFSVGDDKTKSVAGAPGETPLLFVYFDPTLKETFRMGVKSTLEKVILGMEAGEKLKVLSELLPKEMETATRKAMGAMWSEEYRNAIPQVHFNWDNRPIVAIKEEIAGYGGTAKIPTTVQQNVPAWTLFGMFFIVVPLGAALIRERQDGMLARLLTMPISYLTIISGKVFAYVIICMVQFFFIMGVGKVLLPILGAPALEVGSSYAALILIALCASLAASGYGILLGTVARTYEQASTFGAVSVVIAAALGGVMVPVYVMPKIMQTIGLFSPLSWGLTAFLTVFVRGGGIGSILPELMSMFLFFVLTILVAWFYMFKRGRLHIH
ncbi:MAG TPA: ABC transporter permease [Syntrophorhabdaceae bacterium]|jgi:ABC-2 type transport system permease protein